MQHTFRNIRNSIIKKIIGVKRWLFFYQIKIFIHGEIAPVKILITQQLNASEILFSARKQSIEAQRKQLND